VDLVSPSNFGLVLALLSTSKWLAMRLVHRLKVWLLELLVDATNSPPPPLVKELRAPDCTYTITGNTKKDVMAALKQYVVGVHGHTDLYLYRLQQRLYYTTFVASPDSESSIASLSQVVIVLHLAVFNFSQCYELNDKRNTYYFGSPVCSRSPPNQSDDLGDLFYRIDDGRGPTPRFECLRRHPRLTCVDMPANAQAKAYKKAKALADPEQRAYYKHLLKSCDDENLVLSLQYTLLRDTLKTRQRHACTKLRDCAWFRDEKATQLTHVLLDIDKLEIMRCTGGQGERDKKRIVHFTLYTQKYGKAALDRYCDALLRPVDPRPQAVFKTLFINLVQQ
jgi:hypothetical protein